MASLYKCRKQYRRREGKGSYEKNSEELIGYLMPVNKQRFEQERSWVARRDAKFDVSDLSHGSVYEKKEKFITAEAKNHIYKIVDKENAKRAHGTKFSKSFMKAYPELNDLCDLYNQT